LEAWRIRFDVFKYAAADLGMRNLAPDIFRQRLLVEGYYSDEMTADRLAEYLLGLAAL